MNPGTSAVVVSPDPAGTAGGTERMCQDISAVLRRLGFDVTLVGPDRPCPEWLARLGGAFAWQSQSLRRRVRTLQPQPGLIVTVGPWGWPGGRQPPRIHVYVSNLSRLARSQPGPWHWRVRWGLGAGIVEALAARGATVVAVSEQTAEDARRLYRAKVDRVLPLGIDIEVFRPRPRHQARERLGLSPNGRYGLFVGRGEPGKGPGVALDACRRTGWELLAAGARPVAGTRTLGILPPGELAWAYAAVDAVVLPTAYEGWSSVVGEALAVGVPVVTTPVGWARELGHLVPEYRPFLVAPEAEAVAAALVRVEKGEACDAVAAGSALILVDHTMAAFEARWRDLLAEIGLWHEV